MQLSPDSLNLGTWNVEGLSDDKIISLQRMMRSLNIHILCIQETHKPLSGYYITDEGYLVILSGCADEGREYAGVGFIISP